MTPIKDHPLRFSLANELHARPFPTVNSPCQVAVLAIKSRADNAPLDGGAAIRDLLSLLDRFGAQHPCEGATHYFGDMGKFHLKWERHTEFVTYSAIVETPTERPFSREIFEVFPSDWLAEIDGVIVTSALIHLEPRGGESDVIGKVRDWFVPESVALSSVLEDAAVIAGDFRIDSNGHMRFAVFTGEGTGPQRTGRIVQRIIEVETYKSMAMLGLESARRMSQRMQEIEDEMSGLVEAIHTEGFDADTTLKGLLDLSADLENLLARASFRFGASAAYEAIVNQRIEVLREAHLQGGQTFSEFMMRRFDPAMRTVRSTERRLNTVISRAERAANLLSTQVDVDRASQNQQLLTSMDRRADIALRLQQTVEGLSVVAISYYAVNLAVYLLAPIASGLNLSKTYLAAGLTPVVVLIVWLAVRRIRARMGH